LRNGDALIFDFNGTLFWDTAFNMEAWDRVSRLYRGKPYGTDERCVFNGRNSVETARFFLGGDASDETIHRVIEEKERYYRSLCRAKGIPLLAPGAEELIRTAKEAGLRMAIATGAPRSNTESYLQWFPVLSLFGKNILYDDGSRKGKPEPDIYCDAMKLLHCTPEETVVFEDSPPGVEAARRAGVQRIYVVASPYAETRRVASQPCVAGILTDFRSYLPHLAADPSID
jgi:HAD superfamily hydrolase (TIGR01509 family)